MLQVNNLKYAIRSQMGNRTKFIIRNVDFSLEQGYLMCLLGKNGTGKSTLLRLLYGMMPVDQGSVRWNEKDVYENSGQVRQEVAYVGDGSGFFEGRTLQENVEILSMLYHTFNYEKWDDYLKRFELKNVSASQQFREFSTGQKCQIQLAFALARSPKLLLLDEPTANLDPVFRVEFMELLQYLIATEESSVIMSTHILDDVEDIADYIGVMRDGKLIQYGDREGVLEQCKAESMEELILE